ncbi:MAG: class I SAM-dependent methyltransferase [Flavobacteriaceae bacterium]|nr:class I SAM-dependent methyltransferase [Flavobacteriaceae bacterium]
MNPADLMTNVVQVKPGFFKNISEEKDVSYTRNGHELIRSSESESFWFSHRLKIIKSIIGKFKPESIMDIGGGNGQVSEMIQNMDIAVVLLEPRAEGARNASSAGIKTVVNSTFHGAGIKDQSISAISILDVLEHIENDVEFLKECKRILKPDGLIIITVPALPKLFSEFDKEVGHFRRYKLNSLYKKLEESGFHVEFGSYFFYFLPIAIFLVRFLVYPFKSKEKRRSTGHTTNKSLLGKIISVLLKPELQWISNLKKVPFGSSCLAIAKAS